MNIINNNPVAAVPASGWPLAVASDSVSGFAVPVPEVAAVAAPLAMPKISVPKPVAAIANPANPANPANTENTATMAAAPAAPANTALQTSPENLALLPAPITLSSASLAAPLSHAAMAASHDNTSEEPPKPAAMSTDAWLALLNTVMPAVTVPATAAPPLPSLSTATDATRGAAQSLIDAPCAAAPGAIAAPGAATEIVATAATLPLRVARNDGIATDAAASLSTPVLKAEPQTSAGRSADPGDFQSFSAWMQKADAAVLMAPPPTIATAPPAPSVGIAVPVNHPGWGEALGHQVVWSLTQGVQQVQIQLHPAELGPITIHLRVENDQAQLAFSAAHAQTRDALEQALPQLRELLGQEGINLGQASVQSQAQQGGDQQAAADRRAGTLATALEADAVPAEATVMDLKPRQRRGLVDDYV